MPKSTGFAAVLAACLVLAATGLAQRLDLAALDLEFGLLRHSLARPAERDVVVVGIDEASIAALPEPITLWHGHLSRFVLALKKAAPAALGIDVVLPARSFEKVQPGADALLTRSLVEARLAYPLVLALTAGPDGRERPVHPPFLAAVGADGAELALLPVDADGVIRRLEPPSFAGALARHLGAEPRPGFIDFSRGASFSYFSFSEVLAWDEARLKSAFANKPVLLGVVLPFTDDHAAPVQLASWDTGGPRVPGVLLHAQALRTLLGEGPVSAVPKWMVVALAALASLLFFAPAWAALLTAMSFFVASTWALSKGWYLPPATLAAAALVPVAFDAGAKLVERRRLRASFRGYVSPAVMSEILAGRIQPGLAGVRRFVCVMFADIRGYTTRASAMRPEDTIAFLNRYFDRVVGLIHARGGTVVSIMGDGIMAAFGTPKALDNPCREAFQTAIAMLEFVAELNQRLAAEGEAPIDIGIGLNAGEALCGHVGSRERHEYSAIGDVTNVASRLQTLTKEHGYRVLASRAVAELLGRRDLAPLGAVAVKGHAPVEVFGYGRTK
jgi:adenylate cyclase